MESQVVSWVDETSPVTEKGEVRQRLPRQYLWHCQDVQDISTCARCGEPWHPPVANIGAAAPEEAEGHDGALADGARKALPASGPPALSRHLSACFQRMRAIQLADCAAIVMPQIGQRLYQVPALAQHLCASFKGLRLPILVCVEDFNKHPGCSAQGHTTKSKDWAQYRCTVVETMH